MEKYYKFNLSLTPRLSELLDQLVKDTGASSKAEVLRRALGIYGYLVENANKIVNISFKNGIFVAEKKLAQ
jgi:metal-responsive CopG/Arc/MetJ family transcriptional regulator